MFGAVAEASCIVYTFLNIYDWNSFNVLILQLQEASEVASYKDSDVNSADAGPIEWDRNQVVLICLISLTFNGHGWGASRREGWRLSRLDRWRSWKGNELKDFGNLCPLWTEAPYIWQI